MTANTAIDPEELFVLWGDASAHGYIDSLPDATTLLAESYSNTTRHHRVRTPTGDDYGVASYRLRSNPKQKYADLDYGGALKQRNVDAGMDIGVMRLRFSGSLVVAVEWAVGDNEPSQAGAIALLAAEMATLHTVWKSIKESA